MPKEIVRYNSIAEIRADFPNFLIAAWGDESVRVRADPPMYLLGATVFLDDPFLMLEILKKVKPKGAKKLHWRDLGIDAQKQSLEILAGIAHTTTIVVAAPLIKNKQERARRKCLQELLIRLDQATVDCLYLESRNEDQNKKDRDFLQYLRRSKSISRIDIKHIDGKDEMRTCVPDQILGAFVDSENEDGKKPSWISDWTEINKSVKTYYVKP